MTEMLWGALAMACWTAGVFFLSFWRVTSDRLFFWFFAAFWILALSWVGLGIVPEESEARYQVYVLRLLSFVFIILGIVDKNRRSRAAAGQERPAR